MERIEQGFESLNFENSTAVETEELSNRLQSNILKEIKERLSDEVLMYYNKDTGNDRYEKV